MNRRRVFEYTQIVHSYDALKLQKRQLWRRGAHGVRGAQAAAPQELQEIKRQKCRVTFVGDHEDITKIAAFLKKLSKR